MNLFFFSVGFRAKLNNLDPPIALQRIFVCLFATLFLQRKHERNRRRCKRKKFYWTWTGLDEWLIFQAKIEKNHPWRPSPAARELIEFPLPNKRIDFNDIPPALIVSAKLHVKCIWQRMFWWETSPRTRLLRYSPREEGHKKPPRWILQEQLNVAPEERLSYGRPIARWDCAFNDKNKAKNETWTGGRSSPGSFSVFTSRPPLHVLIPGGQVCLWWKQAMGHTYPGWTWFLLSFVLAVWSKRKSSANQSQKWQVISNFGKCGGLVDQGEVLSTRLIRAVSAADNLLAPTSCCASSINASGHHL